MKDLTDDLPGIDRVRNRFLTMLLERQIKIAGHSVAAWEGETLEEVNDNLAAAQAVLHQIAGTAGSLGFADLGEEARSCENAIIAHLKGPDAELAVCPTPIITDLDHFVSSCEVLLTPLTEAVEKDRVEENVFAEDDEEDLDLQAVKTALI